MKVSVGISARHIHLRKESFKKLFGYEELTFEKSINQPHMFASKEKVMIRTENGIIDNVRILGPFREYNQVEISKTDSYLLKIEPPIRASGELEGAPLVTVVGPCGQIEIPAIIANRHIHITKKQADELGIQDKQKVGVKILSNKPGGIVAEFKVSEEAYFELHLDLDDANAFDLHQNDEVEINL